MPRTLWPALLWALFILGLLLLPPGNLPRSGWLEKLHPDKVVHVVLFGVFFVLLVGGFRGLAATHLFHEWPRLGAFLVVVAYALVTEWAQHAFTTGRHAELSDVLADIGGAIAGMGYLRWGVVHVEQFRKRPERYL